MLRIYSGDRRGEAGALRRAQQLRREQPGRRIVVLERRFGKDTHYVVAKRVGNSWIMLA